MSYLNADAHLTTISVDTLFEYKHPIIDTDSLLQSLTTTPPVENSYKLTSPTVINQKKTSRFTTEFDETNAFDSLIIVNKKLDSIQIARSKTNANQSRHNPVTTRLSTADSLMYVANPLFIDLVYENPTLNFDWNLGPDFQKLYYGKTSTSLLENTYTLLKVLRSDVVLSSLRKGAKSVITHSAPELYAFNFDQLPDPDRNKSHLIEEQDLKDIQFVVSDETNTSAKGKLVLAKLKESPWSRRASAMLQFSENVVSKKWYQGGNNSIAVLGIMSGSVNYDDKKSVQWESNGEWRMGFNSIESDIPGRVMQTNDDVFRINSKLGIKAGGNFFYSSSLDFSTQFFNSYKGVNSLDKKTTFLTPVRLNVGVGLDFKLNKKLSFMVSPIAYKFVYIQVTDHVDPNQFGIEKGKNQMKSIGSSFKAISSITVFNDVSIDSRLSFYTDYKKMEIDLEMVANYSINRFMSIRFLFNPRYDNTVIEETGSKAVIQYKQFMSIGFAHKFK
jgi:hypothetical protein